MRFTTLFLAAATAMSCLLPASAQYVRFSKPTDTIQVKGNTALGNAATFEARILLTDKANGFVFRENDGGIQDNYFIVGQLQFTGSSHAGYTDGLGYSIPLVLKQWHHVAYVRDGGQIRLYLDGSLVASSGVNNYQINDGYGRFSVGAWDMNNPSFIGYMDTIRISSIARYGGNFTPPTGDLPADQYTQLLYNFNDPIGSTTVTDEGVLSNDGILGKGFTGATSPTIVATVPEAASVSGTVQLPSTISSQQVVTDPQVSVTIELRPKPSGTPIVSHIVLTPVSANTGSYYISGVPAGTYDIAFKGYSWLRKVIPGVVVSGATTVPLVTLITGDLNGDNMVDIADFGLLVNGYTLTGDP